MKKIEEKMEKKKKKTKAKRNPNKQIDLAKQQVNLDPKDFISALPNDILYHIISFLPIRSAVQTTFLSTQWKDMWKKVFVRHGTSSEAAAVSISNFIINFRQRHPPWFQYNLGPNRVVYVATPPHTSILHLEFSDLEQTSTSFDLLLPLNCGYLYIKTLYLISVSHFSSELFTSLASNLRFLKNLIIAKCNGLKCLEIKDGSLNLEKLVVLDCPNLEKLYSEGFYNLKCFQHRGRLANVQFRIFRKHLYTDVMLDFRQGPIKEWSLEIGNRLNPIYCGCSNGFSCFGNIVQSICEVKYLTICKWFFEKSMCDSDKVFCSNTVRMEQLSELWWIDCSMEEENTNALLYFLKICPNLEKLFVTIDPRCYKLPNSGKFSSGKFVRNRGKLKHLELVKLKGNVDKKAEISFATRLIPIFARSPTVISKPDRTCLILEQSWDEKTEISLITKVIPSSVKSPMLLLNCLRQLIKLHDRAKEEKHPYKLKPVENLQNKHHHPHMKV